MPKPFVPGVKKGFVDACQKGGFAGQKVTGVRMILKDGAHHIVDSSEWAFYQAAQFAFQVRLLSIEGVEVGGWAIFYIFRLVIIANQHMICSRIAVMRGNGLY